MNEWRVWIVLGLLAGAPGLATGQQSQVALRDETAGSELVITIGAVDLPVSGHGSHGGHGGPMMEDAHAPVFPPIDAVEIPHRMYLHGFSYRILDGRGRELPVEILHHLNLIMPDNRELFLPISHRLLAMGKETGEQEVPGGVIGVPVKAGQHIVVAAMLHNPTREAHEGVSVEVRLKYETQRPDVEVFPFQLDIGFPAGDKSVDLPPGRSVFAWEGSPAIPGDILVVGGHLHEHAEKIELKDVTTGETLWTGLPSFNADGDIIGVTVDIFDDESAIRLDPAHSYRVVATYNNPMADTLVDGGMGVVAGVFSPAEGAEWPEADTGDRLYRIDRLHYMREVRGRYDEIVRMIEEGTVSLDGDKH
jgi:hypothetical protein